VERDVYRSGEEPLPVIELFVFLQLLDALTTLVGLRMGAQETNPTIRYFMQLGPVYGLLICKVGVFLLGAYCVWGQRQKVLRAVNYIFAAIVVWNLTQLLAQAG
jgi:hypothetical protein